MRQETRLAVFISVSLIIGIVFGFKDMINKTKSDHNEFYESFRWKR